MKRITLTLQLQEPLIISASNATAGLFETLDYIPGNALLGAVAARSYARLKKDSFHLDTFHSGKVRFGNLTPAGAAPMPLSLHRPKNDRASRCVNRLFPNSPQNEALQLKQLRAGYLTPDGAVLNPTRRLHLRTAINPDTGSAQASQLYAYQAITPEHDWIGHIDCDDEPLARQLHQLLSEEKTLLIGRSRSAHYGRVTIQNLSVQDIPPPKPPVIELDGTACLVLWLASDLCAFDRHTGQPTLSPNLADLHPDLPEAELQADRSFIRTRRYAPYNAWRKHYDPSRQVIQQGSVLVYPLPDGLNPSVLTGGLGTYVAQGLGQLVPHDTLRKILGQPTLDIHKPAARPQPEHTPRTQDPLLAWLEARHSERHCKDTIEEITKTLVNNLHGLYEKAARQTLTPPFGPTRSQWNRVRELAEQHRNETDLKRLFELLQAPGAPWHTPERNPNTQDRTGSAHDGWRAPISTRKTYLDAACQAIQQTFDGIKPTECRHGGLFLRMLAHRMSTHAATQKLAETGGQTQ